MKTMQSTDKRTEEISIIMPAYNSANCIKRGIESCIAQTYGNWTLFVVDDGSADSTAVLVQSYCEKDNRIQYLYQKNAGVSAARNYGLDHAKGEYVVFLDADDWLQSNALDILLCLQREHKDLLIACNRRLVEEEDAQREWNRSISIQDKAAEMDQVTITELTRVDALRNTGTQKYNNSSVNKIFNRKLIEKQRLRFDPSISYGEDGFFVFQYLLAANGMLHYNACLWNLLERRGSATRRNVSVRNLTAIQAIEKMRALLQLEGQNSKDGGMALSEIAEVDSALQSYGGSITYNLVRRYIEGQTNIPEIELECKKALRRYRKAYCMENKGESTVKYLVMCLCPFGGYQLIYRFFHSK